MLHPWLCDSFIITLTWYQTSDFSRPPHASLPYSRIICNLPSDVTSDNDDSSATPTAQTDPPTPTIFNPFHLPMTSQNIRTLITVTLDIKTPNYQKWSHFFTVTAGSFLLTALLHGAPRPPTISVDDWTRGSFLLQSWIYSTISDDLSSMVLSKTASANDLWCALASLFTDNKDCRAIQLEE